MIRWALNDVTVLITTFFRPDYLRACLAKLRMNFDECDVAIACDDDITPTPSLNWSREAWVRLPYDSGLTAKRNATVKMARTKYSLLGCDDFDFSREAYEGVMRMATILDRHIDVDVVVGTYNGGRYEGMIEYVPGSHISTHYLSLDTDRRFTDPYPAYNIDIGPNYFLARTHVLRNMPWDETIRPIGGEHCDWFLSLKEAGKTVVWAPGNHIGPFFIEGVDLTEYRKKRNRAQEGHRLFMLKRNIAKFYGFEDAKP